MKMVICCMCLLRHPGTSESKDKGPGVTLRPKGLGTKMSSASGLKYAHDSFIWSFSPSPSLDFTYSKEIIIPCPLQGQHSEECVKCVLMYKIGWEYMTWQEQKQKKEQKDFFLSHSMQRFPGYSRLPIKLS